MAYASFRCLVDAPFLKVWQSVETVAVKNKAGHPPRQKVSVDTFDLQEIIRLDPQKGELMLLLDSGQPLKGERRFAVRADQLSSKIIIESSLNWHAADRDMDRRVHSMLEILVRDLVLEIKKVSES
jgi:hypothetical protein